MNRYHSLLFSLFCAFFFQLVPANGAGAQSSTKAKADADMDMFNSPIELALAEAEASSKSLGGAQPLEVDFSKEMIRMLGALGVILLLLFGTIYVLRRMTTQRTFKTSAEASINIIERKALSPKSTLYLVDFDGKRTLIAESSNDVRTLAFSDKEESKPLAKESETSTPPASFPSFKDFFKKK